MATSVLMTADTDRETTNPTGEMPFPQDHLQDQDHLPIRRSSGRRRSKGSESSSSMAAGGKKKQPRRGMGVEKLEHLIWQEKLKKVTEINPHHQPCTSINHHHHPVVADPTHLMMMNNASSSPSVHQRPKLTQMNLGFHGQMGFPNSDLQFGISNGCLNQSDFHGKNVVGGFSKELSSTPNAVNCYSRHCNACHKKKKVNGGNLGSETSKQMCKFGECGYLGLNIRDNQNIIKEENQGLATKIPLVKYAVGNGKQGVEVVAVHRKGSSSELEGGRMVMEYEFFPSSGKASSIGYSETSSSSSSSSMAGFVASNCIDLSLKLSY